ncbi:MAG TPA: magnesium transporter CorA family protein [Methylocella sp.]|nr:magnesium transporter CorA family protein [Methylocella sp.]
MLNFYSAATKEEAAFLQKAKGIPPAVNWIDAVRPEDAEIAFLENSLGLKVPTLAALSEIETSSRLRIEGAWLHISLPMIYHPEGFMPSTTPLGFALSKDVLVTVRFKNIKIFDVVRDDFAKRSIQPTGPGALLAILEVIIDHAADVLERRAEELERLSQSIFGAAKASGHGPRQDNERLRIIMQEIGRSGDYISKLEELVLGINRMLPFVTANAASFLEPETSVKFESLQRDLASLSDYETHLTGKIHFLLDATLGLTNIEQNNIFRILTVVSVIGIPPTFFASLWGMNFKGMPELEWPHGYDFALVIIAASAILPTIWFKWRGWW